MERLVALAADLVVVSEYTDADFLRLIERSGMRWHRMEGLSSLAGVRQAILDLGRVVGAEKALASLEMFAGEVMPKFSARAGDGFAAKAGRPDEAHAIRA